jgi:hypothetical protein
VVWEHIGFYDVRKIGGIDYDYKAVGYGRHDESLWGTRLRSA